MLLLFSNVTGLCGGTCVVSACLPRYFVCVVMSFVSQSGCVHLLKYRNESDINLCTWNDLDDKYKYSVRRQVYSDFINSFLTTDRLVQSGPGSCRPTQRHNSKIEERPALHIALPYVKIVYLALLLQIRLTEFESATPV